jgi:hypothetical protein
MATPLPHLRVALGTRPRISTTSSFPPGGPLHARAMSGHATSVTAAQSNTARFLPRHAPSSRGRGRVSLRAAPTPPLLPAGGASSSSTHSRSRGLLRGQLRLQVEVGLPLPLPLHSAAPRAHWTPARASVTGAASQPRPDSSTSGGDGSGVGGEPSEGAYPGGAAEAGHIPSSLFSWKVCFVTAISLKALKLTQGNRGGR